MGVSDDASVRAVRFSKLAYPNVRRARDNALIRRLLTTKKAGTPKRNARLFALHPCGLLTRAPRYSRQEMDLTLRPHLSPKPSRDHFAIYRDGNLGLDAVAVENPLLEARIAGVECGNDLAHGRALHLYLLLASSQLLHQRGNPSYGHDGLTAGSLRGPILVRLQRGDNAVGLHG